MQGIGIGLVAVVVGLSVESDQGADCDAGGVLPAGNADAERGADTADNRHAEGVREYRGEECVLLVSEPQGSAAAEAEGGELCLL